MSIPSIIAVTQISALESSHELSAPINRKENELREAEYRAQGQRTEK